MVIANLMKNAALAKEIVRQVIKEIPTEPAWAAHDALRNAIMTDKKFWPAKTKKQLALLLKKFL